MNAAFIPPSTVTVITYAPGIPTGATESNPAGTAPSSSSVVFTAISGASASASAAASAAGTHTTAQLSRMDTDELLVFWLDIALLCAVGFFFIAAIPRLVARFSRASAWGRGLLMYGGSSPQRHGKNSPAALTPAERLYHQYGVATQWDYQTDQSHTLAAAMEKGWKGDTKFGTSSRPPPHVPAWTTVLYPVSAIFAYNVAYGKSVGKLTLAVLFVAAVVALSFISDGNPLTEPVRPGWIATGLIPVTIAFATKNNLIGMFVGMGYEKLNYLHRWVGIVLFATANLHTIGYIYKWSIKNSLSGSFQKPFIIHGTIALAGVELLFFASLPWVRNKAYKFFLLSHVLGYFLFLIALCYHEDGAIKWVLLGTFIYAFDHVLRLCKTRVSVARMKTIPELGLVRIEMPSLTRGWRAGEHVRLRIFSAELGVLGWTVAHPFTVANSPGSAGTEKSGMTLLVKKCGKWTGKLYDAAGRAGYYPTENGFGTVREMRVVVEGPYGGLGNMMMISFSSALLVGGGSGVSFVLSQAEELVLAVRTGRSSLRFIELVWITQDQASISPLLPTFSVLIDNISSSQGVLLKISIFFSRASPSSAQSNSTLDHLSSLSPTLTVHAGRPALPRILDGLVRLTASLGSERAKGVAVGVCGPMELGEEVWKCTWRIDGDIRRQCGGIEVHEEQVAVAPPIEVLWALLNDVFILCRLFGW